MTHKLLLADDSVTIQRVLELTFSGEDVQVVTVGDGEQAIARIPIDLPDIVLADIGMPKRSGYDVAAFEKGHPDLSHIPVLLLAGAFEPVDETRAQQVHSDGVLVKPFEPQQVISRVRNLIESSRAAARKAAAVTPEAPVIEHRAAGMGDTFAHSAQAAAALPESKAVVAESHNRRDESKLDDYFDRLDAAFSELATDGGGGSGQHGEDEYDGRAVPTLESLLALSATSQPDDQAAPAPAVPVQLGEYEAAPQHPPAARRSIQVSESAERLDGRNLVADMFAALFAAEQGESVAPVTAFPAGAQTPASVSDSLVDEVTRRVLERLAPGAANELVAQIVSDVAERLIREEITRIKAAAAARL